MFLYFQNIKEGGRVQILQLAGCKGARVSGCLGVRVSGCHVVARVSSR